MHADYDINLHADPSLLNKSGEWVNVSWNGVFFPTKQDWLGVWVLPNSSVAIDARKQAPIKFQVCACNLCMQEWKGCCAVLIEQWSRKMKFIGGAKPDEHDNVLAL